MAIEEEVQDDIEIDKKYIFLCSKSDNKMDKMGQITHTKKN